MLTPQFHLICHYTVIEAERNFVLLRKIHSSCCYPAQRGDIPIINYYATLRMGTINRNQKFCIVLLTQNINFPRVMYLLGLGKYLIIMTTYSRYTHYVNIFMIIFTFIISRYVYKAGANPGRWIEVRIHSGEFQNVCFR